MAPTPRTHAQELIHIEQLIDTDKFNEALLGVKILEKQESLAPTDRLTCDLLKSAILNKLSNYKEGLRLAEYVLNDRIMVHSMVPLAMVHSSSSILMNWRIGSSVFTEI